MNILLCGRGRMGALLEEMIGEAEDLRLLGIVHPGCYESPLDVPGRADAVLDFSYPGNLAGVLARARRDGCAAVIGTTGLSEAQVADIRAAAAVAPIVYSANFSVGIAILRRAVRLAAPALLDRFDAEIVETHHNQKADAPSGTAKLLLSDLDPEGALPRVFGRSGVTGPRGREIGVHALRGGTVAGEHSVFFFGEDELLEFRHSATSRRIFAAGALRAARFAAGRPAGLYDMEDVLEG